MIAMSVRKHPVLNDYEIVFSGRGQTLITLMQLMKAGRVWNSTAKQELEPQKIDEVIKHIQEGK